MSRSRSGAAVRKWDPVRHDLQLLTGRPRRRRSPTDGRRSDQEAAQDRHSRCCLLTRVWVKPNRSAENVAVAASKARSRRRDPHRSRRPRTAPSHPISIDHERSAGESRTVSRTHGSGKRNTVRSSLSEIGVVGVLAHDSCPRVRVRAHGVGQVVRAVDVVVVELRNEPGVGLAQCVIQAAPERPGLIAAKHACSPTLAALHQLQLFFDVDIIELAGVGHENKILDGVPLRCHTLEQACQHVRTTRHTDDADTRCERLKACLVPEVASKKRLGRIRSSAIHLLRVPADAAREHRTSVTNSRVRPPCSRSIAVH